MNGLIEEKWPFSIKWKLSTSSFKFLVIYCPKYKLERGPGKARQERFLPHN